MRNLSLILSITILAVVAFWWLFVILVGVL